jgi:hypothetical protein
MLLKIEYKKAYKNADAIIKLFGLDVFVDSLLKYKINNRCCESLKIYNKLKNLKVSDEFLYKIFPKLFTRHNSLETVTKLLDNLLQDSTFLSNFNSYYASEFSNIYEFENYKEYVWNFLHENKIVENILFDNKIEIVRLIPFYLVRDVKLQVVDFLQTIGAIVNDTHVLFHDSEFMDIAIENIKENFLSYVKYFCKIFGTYKIENKIEIIFKNIINGHSINYTVIKYNKLTPQFDQISVAIPKQVEINSDEKVEQFWQKIIGISSSKNFYSF